MFSTRPWPRLGALAAVFLTVSMVSIACGAKEEPTPQETPTATARPTTTPVPAAPTATPTVPPSPTVVPEPKSATVNLSGTWESPDYQCPFGTYHLEIIRYNTQMVKLQLQRLLAIPVFRLKTLHSKVLSQKIKI